MLDVKDKTEFAQLSWGREKYPAGKRENHNFLQNFPSAHGHVFRMVHKHYPRERHHQVSCDRPSVCRGRAQTVSVYCRFREHRSLKLTPTVALSTRCCGAQEDKNSRV